MEKTNYIDEKYPHLMLGDFETMKFNIDEKYPHLMLGDFQTMKFNRKTYSEKTTFGSVVSEQTEQTGEKCKCRSADVTLTPLFLQNL